MVSDSEGRGRQSTYRVSGQAALYSKILSPREKKTGSNTAERNLNFFCENKKPLLVQRYDDLNIRLCGQF